MFRNGKLVSVILAANSMALGSSAAAPPSEKLSAAEEAGIIGIAMGGYEPRTRYCEGGKAALSADLVLAQARALLAPHQLLSQYFEIEFKDSRKKEEAALGDILNSMDCGKWPNEMRKALEDLRGTVAAYELTHPGQ